jgi:hypothetical protein
MEIVKDLDWKDLDWKKLTTNVLIGYAVSWGVFFSLLGFFQQSFGKSQGLFLNYIFSWTVWFLTSYTLLIYNPNGEKKVD